MCDEDKKRCIGCGKWFYELSDEPDYKSIKSSDRCLDCYNSLGEETPQETILRDIERGF